MEPRREYALALTALGVGAALVLLVLQPTWVVVRLPPVDGSALLEPLTGSALVPSMYALGLLGLAGCVAVVATRGVFRRVVGGVVTISGVVTAVSAALVLVDPLRRALPHLQGTAAGSDTANTADAAVASFAWWWPAIALVGGVLVVAAGVVVVAHGTRWPAMASRYDAPSTAAAGLDAPAATRGTDPWRALDRGEDPTLAPGESPDGGRLPE